MHQTILAATLCFSILLDVTAYGAQRSELKDTTESQFKVGQVWTYWTRSQEKQSTFIVLKVEKHPTLGNIIHIASRRLKIRKPNVEFKLGAKIYKPESFQQQYLRVLAKIIGPTT